MKLFTYLVPNNYLEGNPLTLQGISAINSSAHKALRVSLTDSSLSSNLYSISMGTWGDSSVLGLRGYLVPTLINFKGAYKIRSKSLFGNDFIKI
jgi:hypothetical protein